MLQAYKGSDKIAVYCYVYIACLSELALSHSDTTLYPEWFRHLYLYSIFIALLLALVIVFTRKLKDTSSFLIPAIYFSFITLYSNFDISINSFFDAVYSTFRIMGFLLMMPLGKIRIYECFTYFIVFMCACGIFVYISHILHLPVPHSEIPYYTDSVFASYIDYKIGILFSELGAIRLCGLFNEPGAFGTFLALILCIEDFDLKKRENVIMALAGLLSFSVAFFIISLLYLIMKMRKDKRLLVPLTILLIFIVFILPNLEFSNPILQAFTNRLKFDDGAFVADTRSSDFVDEKFSDMLYGDHLFWGFKGKYLVSIDYENTTSTFKVPFIEYGMIGFFVIYGILLINALKRTKGISTAIMFVLCFAFSVYQRPYIYTLTYFVILYGGIEYIKRRDLVVI